MMLNPLDSALKRDRVAHAIREAILSGELRPGERIVELKLASRLAVSQTPVREALAALASEGLVVQLEHRGTFVASLSEQELREVVSLRAVLEAYCARLAAARLSGGDFARLEAQVDAMRDAARAGDLSGLTEADLRFHELLSQVSGHELLAEVLSGLHHRMRVALAFADAAYSSELTDVAESHIPLLEALRTKEPEFAERAARDHVLDIAAGLGGDELTSEGTLSRAATASPPAEPRKVTSRRQR